MTSFASGEDMFDSYGEDLEVLLRSEDRAEREKAAAHFGAKILKGCQR